MRTTIFYSGFSYLILVCTIYIGGEGPFRGPLHPASRIGLEWPILVAGLLNKLGDFFPQGKKIS